MLRTICAVNAHFALDAHFSWGNKAAMTDKHPHAAAIDAVGETLIRGHYNLSKRGWQNWRKYGVPRIHWKSLDLLAQVKGKPLPRLNGPAAL